MEGKKHVFPSCKNGLFEVKNESKMINIIKEIKKINNDNYKIKENQIEKIKNNINKNNIIIKNHLIINYIRFIIIDLFFKIKSDILFDLFYFQNSQITLKIKGIGESFIFGNEKGCNFTGINYLKEVYINGNKQNTIEYKYYFNQTDNFVVLILDNNINNCKYMFRKCKLIYLILILHKLHL